MGSPSAELDAVEKHLLVLPEFEPRFFDYPVRNIITMPTELSRLPINTVYIYIYLYILCFQEPANTKFLHCEDYFLSLSIYSYHEMSMSTVAENGFY
jgi:hypothetical protein